MNVHHFYFTILLINLLYRNSFDITVQIWFIQHYNKFSVFCNYGCHRVVFWSNSPPIFFYLFFNVEIRLSFLSQTFYWFWYDITNEKLEHPIMMIINSLKAHDGADCSIIKVKSSLRYPYWRKLIQTSKRMLEQN